MALLAGDGLLIEAFRHMASAAPDTGVPAGCLLEVIQLIARASGYEGMVGGQAVDVRCEGMEVDFSTVEFIHRHKTGALIRASVLAGAMLCEADSVQIEKISAYGSNVGLAFQVADDILDIEADSSVLGKKAGADANRHKNTAPSVIGLEKSRSLQKDLIDAAVNSLEGFDEKADPLRQIALYIIERDR